VGHYLGKKTRRESHKSYFFGIYVKIWYVFNAFLHACRGAFIGKLFKLSKYWENIVNITRLNYWEASSLVACVSASHTVATLYLVAAASL